MFRTVQGKKIENLTDYIKHYVEEHPGIQIIVGCDSQNYSRDTVYVTAVVLYTPGHGGHVIFEKERLPKERIRATRKPNQIKFKNQGSCFQSGNSTPFPYDLKLYKFNAPCFGT